MKFTHHYLHLKKTGIKISYREANAGQSPAYVFLHGLRGNSLMSIDFGQEFSGRHVVLLDLPGYGDSDSLPTHHTMRNMAAAVAEFIELKNLTGIVLMGHSFGATIAMFAAAWHPKNISQLALITPLLTQAGVFLSVTKAYYAFYTKLPIRLQRLLLTNYPLVFYVSMLLLSTKDKDIRKFYRQGAYNSSKLIDPRTVAEAAKDLASIDFMAAMKELKMPTLLLAGELDKLTTSQSLKSASTNLSLGFFHEIKGVGHLPVIEKPHETAKVITEFIQNLRAPANLN